MGHSLNWRVWRVALTAALLAILGAAPQHGKAQVENAAPSSQMRDYLESRVRENPQDASGWRMLGKVLAQAGETGSASAALERAVSLDPNHVAAQFDLGELHLTGGDLPAAAERFRRVASLAPDSNYAHKAREHLARLPSELSSEVIPASYEIKRFDGVDQTGPLLPADQPATRRRPFNLRLEWGGLYNSNAALSPTSREFFASGAASLQGFVNPDLEYRLINDSVWRAGPRFVGYFNVNEREFGALNLQSYQPAFFVERSIPLSNTVLAPRAQYIFIHDEFRGQTFANRHALTTSLTSFWDSGNTSVGYWTGDYTNFADDGGDPATSSRDGFNTALGASHMALLDAPWVRAVSGGIEFQYADTVGTNFTFAGVSLHAEAEVPLAETWSAVIEGGWGYRDYFQAALVPSRNENVWLAGLRIRKHFSPQWSVAGVCTYNRFDSANAFFQAERLLTGVVSIHEY